MASGWFLPEAGVTKAEVAAYYLTVAERLLEHLADRPVAWSGPPRASPAKSSFSATRCPA